MNDAEMNTTERLPRTDLSPDDRGARSARRLRAALVAIFSIALLLLSHKPVRSADKPAPHSAQPTRDTLVETRLVARALKPALRNKERTLSDQQTYQLVRELIQSARRDGDPRTIAYAQTLLARWPAEAGSSPIEARVLHATVAQRQHRFAEARSILDQVLKEQSQHAQALLTRATIAQVMGDAKQARSDCRQLQGRAPGYAQVCLAMADAISGQLEPASLRLERLISTAAEPLLSWALASAGDLYAMRGDWRGASRRYESALAHHQDLNTRLALADAWLAQALPTKALAALADAPQTDAVVLRRWQASRALDNDSARQATRLLHQQLVDRFELQSARQDAIHTREAAWFALDSGQDAAALRLARINWQTQHEPIDLWLLARAANANDDLESARLVRDWISRSGLSDARIDSAMRAARALGPQAAK